MLKGDTDLSLDTHHNRVKNSSPARSNSSLLPLRLLAHPLTFRPETRGGRAGVIVDGTGLTPPTPEAHGISITSLHPRNVVPPPPQAGKHTSPTPEPTAGTPPPSPHGSAKFGVRGRLGTPAPRLRRSSGKLLPAAPELRQSGGRRAPPRPGPQPPRRPPSWPRPPVRGPPPTGIYLRGAAAGSGLGPARVRPSAPAHPRRRRPLKMNEAEEGRRERGKDGPASTGSARRRRRLLTAAAESGVAVRAAAVATDATGNECTAAPRLSGGQTSFGLEHPERHRTRK